jgi:hypothetical protein
LFCAGVAGQRGLQVLLIDHSPRVAEKIRISGGRCNFTNVQADRPECYISAQPGFARHALRAYRPAEFIGLVRRHGIGYHEKHRGQLFCDDSSERIVGLLAHEAESGGVAWRSPCAIGSVAALPPDERDGARFEIATEGGAVRARSLVVATGGLSIPKIGATDLGYRLARQFGHRIVEPRPALVPLTFEPQWQPWGRWPAFAGGRIAPGPEARCSPKTAVHPPGPVGAGRAADLVVLAPRQAIEIDLAPERTLGDGPHRAGRGAAASRAAARICPSGLRRRGWITSLPRIRSCAQIRGQVSNRDLAALAARFRALAHRRGTEGYRRRKSPSAGSTCRTSTRARRNAFRSVLHQRGRRRHRLAGRLQLPMGVGICPRRGDRSPHERRVRRCTRTGRARAIAGSCGAVAAVLLAAGRRRHMQGINSTAGDRRVPGDRRRCWSRRRRGSSWCSGIRPTGYVQRSAIRRRWPDRDQARLPQRPARQRARRSGRAARHMCGGTRDVGRHASGRRCRPRADRRCVGSAARRLRSSGADVRRARAIGADRRRRAGAGVREAP